MTNTLSSPNEYAVGQIQSYKAYFLLLLIILATPQALNGLFIGETAPLSPEWYFDHLLISLTTSFIGLSTAIYFKNKKDLISGFVLSFFFSLGLNLCLSLCQSGIFNSLEPFTFLITGITLIICLSASYQYFYTPYFLFSGGLDYSLTKSRELITAAPLRPFGFIITSMLVSFILRGCVRFFDPALETVPAILSASFLSVTAIPLISLLSATQAAVFLNGEDTSLKAKPSFTTRMLYPKMILPLFAISFLFGQINSGMLRSQVPTPTMKLISAHVSPKEFTVKLSLEDSKHLLRGFNPTLFFIAGKEKLMFKEIGLLKDFLVTPPAEKGELRIKPTSNATIDLIFMPSPLSPELWRTPKEFKAIEDLYLWYGDNKVTKLTID